MGAGRGGETAQGAWASCPPAAVCTPGLSALLAKHWQPVTCLCCCGCKQATWKAGNTEGLIMPPSGNVLCCCGCC
ncbi:hypothetical protein BD289DRAFT_439038 [Coniella lustricola]|uniref:Uncharacterized protein n=1 Tax=Coniella lustricola TaxID=2025994 RepID=A0A2T3A218_9PEZI|nr:hypothetical protein BD289DRAFT_439038 [Coniella lustricola]